MAKKRAPVERGRDDAEPSNHSWIVWTVSGVAYLALMLGACALSAGIPI